MNCFFKSQQPKYVIIAKDFLEDYNNASTNGILYLSRFYYDDSHISINVHRNGKNRLSELIGFNAMAQQMIDTGIYRIKYYNASGVIQPAGQNAILIEFHGKAEFGANQFDIKMILIVKQDNNLIKIVNQILEIYF